jgi:transcriptional regulator with XRE-family HTH domain
MGAMEVSGFLKARRMAAGITQAELGRRVHVTPSVISAYEHGTREPKAGVFVELLQALGTGSVPIAEIVSAHRSRILVDVLQLAEALPYQPRPLAMSPLGRSTVALGAETLFASGLTRKGESR